MEKEYDIRHNYYSVGDENRWLVIDVKDKREIQVSEVIISCESKSSSTYVKGKGYLYNINCKGHLRIEDNVAYITSKKENKVLRGHILKTISYRLLATSGTITGAYVFGFSIQASVLFGFVEIVWKPILYFAHERLWYKFQKMIEK